MAILPEITLHLGAMECGKDTFSPDADERCFPVMLNGVTVAVVHLTENDAGMSESLKMRLEKFNTLAKLVGAVEAGEYSIACEDIEGHNWFDLRDELFS